MVPSIGQCESEFCFPEIDFNVCIKIHHDWDGACTAFVFLTTAMYPGPLDFVVKKGDTLAAWLKQKDLNNGIDNTSSGGRRHV